MHCPNKLRIYESTAKPKKQSDRSFSVAKPKFWI